MLACLLYAYIDVSQGASFLYVPFCQRSFLKIGNSGQNSSHFVSYGWFLIGGIPLCQYMMTTRIDRKKVQKKDMGSI